jgi:hypothetical protein
MQQQFFTIFRIKKKRHYSSSLPTPQHNWLKELEGVNSDKSCANLVMVDHSTMKMHTFPSRAENTL